MTREELVRMREYKVAQASTEYWNKNKDNDEISIMTAFEDGIAWADEHQKNPWISVEDRLPDIGQKVITITNKGKMLLVARTTQPPHKEEGGWRWEHYIGKVTHWMPIPQIEKGE